MTEATQQSIEMFKLVEAWTETATNFWKNLSPPSEETKQGGGFTFNFNTEDPAGDGDQYRTYRTWETSLNNFASFMKLMLAPQNREVLLNSAGNVTEALLQATGESMENLMEFQGQLIESFAKVGAHTKAYTFDDLDHAAFESFRDFYRSEMQKYLNIPKIGLPREFQEKMSQLLDKSNIFQSHVVELLYLFFLPFEKTNRVIQEKTKQMLEQGEFNDDFKAAYSEWVKILEGHFMELLNSKEYTDVLNNTIRSLAEYKSVKTDVTNVFLKDLQIPTNRDMDEVYKDLYQMKRKIKELTKQIETLQNTVKTQAA